MRTNLLSGLVVAASVAALTLVGGDLGLDVLWPVLLGAGLGLLLGLPRLRHVLALIGGGGIAVLGAAADLLLLPDAAPARALSVALAVVAMTSLSALTRGRLPLGVVLIGWASATALLAPRLATDPTTFAVAAVTASAVGLLGLGLGLLAAQVAALVGRGVLGIERSGRHRAGLPSVAPFALFASLALVAVASPAAAALADGAIEGEVTSVQHRQAVLLPAATNGVLGSGRVVTQLVVTGSGAARITLEDQAVTRLRALHTWRKVEVQGTSVIHDLDLRGGAASVRTVADLEREPPFRLDVRYELDGVEVTAAQVVGASGRLTVTHTLTNLTAVPQEVRAFDGQGRPRTVVRDVAVPLVGTVVLHLDARFRAVGAPDAHAVTLDERGVTTLEGEWALFAPIGAPVQRFTWSADVTDAVVPATTLRLMPLVVAGTPSGDATLARLASSAAGLRAVADDATLLTTMLTALRAGIDPGFGAGTALVEQMGMLVARIVEETSGDVTELNEQRALLVAQDARRADGEGLVHPLLEGADASTVYIVEVAGRGIDTAPSLPLRLLLAVLVASVVGLLGRSVASDRTATTRDDVAMTTSR